MIRSATVRVTGECVAEREMRMHPLHGEGALRMEKGIEGEEDGGSVLSAVNALR